ncbi:MAG: glycosyltransferase family 2 protein [Acidimicrobiia bacterium]
MPTPPVTIIVPARNEADAIGDCLGSMLGQDYAGEVEIIVADGGSTDGTKAVVGKIRSTATVPVRLIDNPAQVQTEGFNAAAAIASGEILVRADAHTTYAPDYVGRAVACLVESDAVAVGGPMTPNGTNAFGRAVATAMSSPLAIGPAKFHHATRRMEADTVYLGTFRRTDFLEAGGYRTLPSGVAEDADLYFRWRRRGRTVILDPAIRSTYQTRSAPAPLFRQYFKYGRGKAEMLYLNRRFPSWRPLAPLALVLALTGSLVTLAWTGWPLLVTSAAWLAVLLAVALTAGRQAVRVIWATVLMQVGYGTGLLFGLIKGPSAIQDLR